MLTTIFSYLFEVYTLLERARILLQKYIYKILCLLDIIENVGRERERGREIYK